MKPRRLSQESAKAARGTGKSEVKVSKQQLRYIDGPHHSIFLVACTVNTPAGGFLFVPVFAARGGSGQSKVSAHCWCGGWPSATVHTGCSNSLTVSTLRAATRRFAKRVYRGRYFSFFPYVVLHFVRGVHDDVAAATVIDTVARRPHGIWGHLTSHIIHHSYTVYALSSWTTERERERERETLQSYRQHNRSGTYTPAGALSDARDHRM